MVKYKFTSIICQSNHAKTSTRNKPQRAHQLSTKVTISGVIKQNSHTTLNPQQQWSSATNPTWFVILLTISSAVVLNFSKALGCILIAFLICKFCLAFDPPCKHILWYNWEALGIKSSNNSVARAILNNSENTTP